MKHKKEILRLRAEGKTYNEISEITGASKGTIAYHCGVGQREKTNARTRKHRAKHKEWFDNYKEELGCHDCKKEFPAWMLDFDHLPEYSKRGNPARLAQRFGWQVGLEELKRCEVVCPNCHRIRTYTRAQDAS